MHTKRLPWRKKQIMQAESAAEFKGWRSFLWPVHRWELKKFLPMFFIYFLVSFNYNVLRIYKDTMVVSDSGAEALPFIKVWAILPGAFLLTFLFTRLANRFTIEKVFYMILGGFLAFFILFAFVLFPLESVLHPHALADRMQAALPEGLKGFIAVFRNWTFTLFYVISDLWSTAIMSVLFWGFANEVTKVSEARRFYVLWSIGANVAGIFAGQMVVFNGNTPWEKSVFSVCMMIVGIGLVAMTIFRWYNKAVVHPTQKAEALGVKKEKMKLSMRKNFAYLAKSKYLLCIALIVLCYNVGINLIEVVWKNQVREMLPNKTDYKIYMGQVVTWAGVIATTISIFVSGNIVRKFSWTVSALITPVIVMIVGGLFFFFTLTKGTMAWGPLIAIGTTPLMLSAFFGSVHNCVTRACKYTLFDATKEMSFIPLNSESKLKGKAAIDGVGSRLGKSGGSVIHQALLIPLVTVAASAPYIAGIFLIVGFIWILSVISLGKQFDQLNADHAKLNIQEPAKAPKPAYTQS